jgi:hypothetical protein
MDEADSLMAWLLTDQGLGGRHWTQTNDLLHVKRFRLSAVLGTWEAEQNRISYTVKESRRYGDA